MTIQTNPTRFLNIAFNANPYRSVATKVVQKPIKTPTFSNTKYLKFKSQITEAYKRNNAIESP